AVSSPSSAVVPAANATAAARLPVAVEWAPPSCFHQSGAAAPARKPALPPQAVPVAATLPEKRERRGFVLLRSGGKVGLRKRERAVLPKSGSGPGVRENNGGSGN